jgi:hypothetical protein
MWMPRQLTEHRATLEALGLEIPVSQLADPSQAPLAAAVWLGGCSASFVSPDGLIVTNHHCVTGILQYNSSADKNLVLSGYAAKSRAQELWAGPTQKAYVARRIEDVTEQMVRGIADIADPKQRYLEMEAREKKLVAACEKDRPEVRCRVAKFFGGEEFELVEQLQLHDLRLVFAPPASVGNYGGEIDNWMWPRHTGDFAFVRAYVGSDGKPAEHSEKNVPYSPKDYLKVAQKGVSAGDLVFVMGYPGGTSRNATAAAAERAVSWLYPRSIAAFKEYLAVIEKLGQSDPERALKATPMRRGLANYLKKYEGMMAGLDQGGLLEERTAIETRLSAWIGENPERQKIYGDLLARLKQVQERRDRFRDRDAALTELVRNGALLSAADQIVHMAQERPKPDVQREPEFQQRNWDRIEAAMRALDKRYDRVLDRGLLATAIRRALKMPADQRPEVMGALIGAKAAKSGSEGAIEGALERMYAQTKLESADNRIALLRKATIKQLKHSKDPFIHAALALRRELEQVEASDKVYAGEMVLLAPLYSRATREMCDKPHAPDANSTLRVTFGTVKGYAPKFDAATYEPFTWISQMAAKHTGKDPFDAPTPLLDAIAKRRFGPYTAAPGKEVPVDFLADTDITNGNSGSPTLNARGELVGLAFDGNYEAMASDWLFMPAVTRTIHTDIRYVLWVLDVLDGDRVLEELGVKPTL